MIVSLVSSLELLLWLTRINTLQYRESSEILECELQLSDSLGTCQVLRLLSLSTLLDLLPHYFIYLFNITLT